MSSIAKLLAVLVAENGSYTYVDKLAYAPSKDLVFYYLREALRDFHSLRGKTRWENQRAREEADKVDMESVEDELQQLDRVERVKELRERVSLITAKALAMASGLMEEGAPLSGKVGA